jgi:hypothetical protein
VQHGHRDDRRDVKPDADVDVLLAPPGDGEEEVQAEEHPDDRDGQVDGPLELGVLLALRLAERQRDGRGDDDGLPAVEVDLAQQVARHAGAQQPLGRVVDAGEDHVAHEREDDRVGVQGPEPAEGQLGQDVGRRQDELDGHDEADQEAYEAPADGREQEAARAVVVEDDGALDAARRGFGCHGFLRAGAGASPASGARARRSMCS